MIVNDQDPRDEAANDAGPLLPRHRPRYRRSTARSGSSSSLSRGCTLVEFVSEEWKVQHGCRTAMFTPARLRLAPRERLPASIEEMGWKKLLSPRAEGHREVNQGPGRQHPQRRLERRPRAREKLRLRRVDRLRTCSAPRYHAGSRIRSGTRCHRPRGSALSGPTSRSCCGRASV